MAFFARVADPLVGGTYMTLMNICYVGSKLFKNFSIWLVDVITWKSCIANENFSNSTILLAVNKCADDSDTRECISNGGHCRIDIDGYYIEFAANVIYGIIWYHWGKKAVDYLQRLPVSDWHVLSNHSDKKIQELVPLHDVKAKV